MLKAIKAQVKIRARLNLHTEGAGSQEVSGGGLSCHQLESQPWD